MPVIVEAKLAPPALPAELVGRGRLTHAVDRAARLAAVVAPAGSGKTTLCAQLAVERTAAGEAVAWVTLDGRDQDPVRFWAHVLAAIDRIGVAAPEATDPSDDLVFALTNALGAYATPVTLVLDDYQAVRSPSVDEAIAVLVESLPVGAQLVIASRVDPALPLPRLRVRGQLAEVRAADLSFTPGEAKDLYARTLGLDLTEEQVARLQSRTEGWAAALYVAGLGVRRADDVDAFITSFAGDQAHLVDYLTSEILDRQPDRVRDFLLRTSVLDELCAESCDAVLATTGSGAQLEELERSNLFVVAIDERRRVYRYHQLFADLLRSQLARLLPDEVPELRRRAGDWLAAAGAPSGAIWQYIESGEYGHAKDLINEWWIEYANSGRSATVWSWLDGMPPEVRDLDPSLCLQAGWARLNQQRYDEIEDVLAAAEQSPDASPAVTLEAAMIRAHLARHVGDAAGSLAQAQRANADLDALDPVHQATALAVLGLARAWTGDAEGAVDALSRAVPLGLAVERSAVVLSQSHMALLSAVAGERDEAEAHVRKALVHCRTPEQEAFHIPFAAWLARARVALDEYRLGDAADHLDRADRIATSGHEPLAGVVVRAWRAELAHLGGDVESARGELRAAEVDARALIHPGWARDLVARSKQAIRFAPRGTGDPAELTARELTVLRLLQGTATRQEIADELHVSLATVKTHMHSIGRKLGRSSRAEIVARAREVGILQA